jgi:hypothetical protein
MKSSLTNRDLHSFRPTSVSTAVNKRAWKAPATANATTSVTEKGGKKTKGEVSVMQLTIITIQVDVRKNRIQQKERKPEEGRKRLLRWGLYSSISH